MAHEWKDSQGNKASLGLRLLLSTIDLTLRVLWELVKLVFLPIRIWWWVSRWLTHRRWLAQGKQRLAFIAPDALPEALAVSPPRRGPWHGAAVDPGAEDRAYYLDLLLRGRPGHAVVVFVERTQHEDFSTYEIAYVLRRPTGEVELVVDDNGCRTDPSRPEAMYRWRQQLMWTLNAQPGDVFTALCNSRGDHVLFETLHVFSRPGG